MDRVVAIVEHIGSDRTLSARPWIDWCREREGGGRGVLLVATGRRSRVVVKERRGLRNVNAHFTVASVVDQMDESNTKLNSLHNKVYIE